MAGRLDTEASSGTSSDQCCSAHEKLAPGQFEINQVVWAEWPEGGRLCWWPCVVIDNSQQQWRFVGPPHTPQHRFVVWLGDGTLSQLGPGKIFDFWTHFNTCRHNIPAPAKVRLIIRQLIALSAVRARVSFDPSMTEADVLQWADQNAGRFTKLKLGETFYLALDRTKAEKDCIEREHGFTRKLSVTNVHSTLVDAFVFR